MGGGGYYVFTMFRCQTPAAAFYALLKYCKDFDEICGKYRVITTSKQINKSHFGRNCSTNTIWCWIFIQCCFKARDITSSRFTAAIFILKQKLNFYVISIDIAVSIVSSL